MGDIDRSIAVYRDAETFIGFADPAGNTCAAQQLRVGGETR